MKTLIIIGIAVVFVLAFAVVMACVVVVEMYEEEDEAERREMREVRFEELRKKRQ